MFELRMIEYTLAKYFDDVTSQNSQNRQKCN